jgi:hypothetical protein
MRKIPCALFRGGTSKGVVFCAEDLPPAGDERDRVLLRLMGSPDLRQIDGLGGANSLTSKVAVLSRSEREDADLDYDLGQVLLDRPEVAWNGTCGNLASAAGLFALEEGLVGSCAPATTVRFYSLNVRQCIHVTVPVAEGRPVCEGDFRIPGVPFPGSRIVVEFCDPVGGITGSMLPTGQVRERVILPDGRVFDVSVVDAGLPMVFLLAENLGLRGDELPGEIEARPEILETLETVRKVLCGRIAEHTGMTSMLTAPDVPKIGFFARSAAYRTAEGKVVEAAEVDFLGRAASMQKMHRAYMVSGAVCTAAAAVIPGTVVNELLGTFPEGPQKVLRLGQPYGAMNLHITEENGRIARIGVERSARRLMDGHVYVPEDGKGGGEPCRR